jgi:hypothetical protein
MRHAEPQTSKKFNRFPRTVDQQAQYQPLTSTKFQ